MKELLLPISFLYAIALKIRHKLFDWGMLRSRKWDIPTICIGNLELGGTGKTPLTEYLVKTLMTDYKVAIVSGGYKRKSKEIVIANEQTSLDELGDEPMQYHRKFGNKVSLAVGKDRNLVIERLLKETSTDVIILDDAFQHRKISAGFNILTTNYLNPFTNNFLIPVGTLRDLRSRAKAADIIIVNKTPADATNEQKNILRQKLAQNDNQKVFFASIKYGEPMACNEAAKTISVSINSNVVALCGIAQPDYFINYLETNFNVTDKLIFRDHHDFSKDDIDSIKKVCGKDKIIITTEKDAVRLTNNPYFSTLKETPIYFIPIEVGFDENETSQLKKEITSYVTKDK